MLYLNFYARRGCAQRITIGDNVNAAVLTRRRNKRREVSHGSEQRRRQVLKLIRRFSVQEVLDLLVRRLLDFISRDFFRFHRLIRCGSSSFSNFGLSWILLPPFSI